MGSVMQFITQFAAVAGVLAGVITWGYNYIGKPWAQELITETVQSQFDALEQSTMDLKTSIDRLVRGQTAETNQSEEEARINRQILCLQELAVDPTRGTIEDCQAIE